MGESKQVKVDNWGIFFLQRLQQYFNKTYFCDLTLQFEGNVQLKVHRLVVNTCTEYFQILEQTCEVINDCLIMPPELQADVVVPIVNFMYTGILEFQEAIFTRLYAAAQLMNMTVLTKLLDAQKVVKPPVSKPVTRRSTAAAPVTVTTPATGAGTTGAAAGSAPVIWNLQGKKVATKPESDLPEPLPGRKLPIWKRKSVPNTLAYRSTEIPTVPDPLSAKYFKSNQDETPKPTRFEWPDDDDDNNFDTSSFDEISYTSKPIILPTREKSPKPSTSNFEELKKSTGSVKRAASPIYGSSKRVNIQDVKEYLKEQKLRSDYIDYDDAEAADNDLQSYNDDDSADEGADKNGIFDQNTEETPSKSILKTESSTVTHNKRVRFSLEEKENTNAKTVTVQTTETPAKSDQTTPDLSNHTKIITEVLKRYPHLVKKNKNIRLKILAKGASNTNNAKAANSSTNTAKSASKVSYMVMKQDQNKIASLTQSDKKDGHWSCHKCSNPNPIKFDSYYLFRKHMTDVHKEKFDSQMCSICGHQSRKQNMLVYHKYVKHGIEPPAMYQFPKCPECSYIALSQTLLVKHQYNHTHGNHTCTQCATVFRTRSALISHVQLTGHANATETSGYDCTYCPKKFNSEDTLFEHIKTDHREDAQKDGLITSDDLKLEKENNVAEDVEHQEKLVVQSEESVPEVEHASQSQQPPAEKKRQKIKILSNVKINKPVSEIIQSGASTSRQKEINTDNKKKAEAQTLEPSSEAESLSNVASGIAASLGLVNTIVVLDENQFILHPDNNRDNSTGSNQDEYIIPDISTLENMSELHVSQNQVITSENNTIISQAALNKTNIASTDELVMVLTDHDYSDASNNTVLTPNSSNIVVLYSHPVQGQENATQYIAQQGNLMLNSDMGLMEVDEHYNVTNGMQLGEKPCEESIEMIQQEINSQLEPEMSQSIHTEQPNKMLQEEAVTYSEKVEMGNDQLATTETQEGDILEKNPTTTEMHTPELQVAEENQLENKDTVTNCDMNMEEGAMVQYDEPMETEETIELIQKEVNDTAEISGANSAELSTTYTSPVLVSHEEAEPNANTADILEKTETEQSAVTVSEGEPNAAMETPDESASTKETVQDESRENVETLAETADKHEENQEGTVTANEIVEEPMVTSEKLNKEEEEEEGEEERKEIQQAIEENSVVQENDAPIEESQDNSNEIEKEAEEPIDNVKNAEETNKEVVAAQNEPEADAVEEKHEKKDEDVTEEKNEDSVQEAETTTESVSEVEGNELVEATEKTTPNENASLLTEADDNKSEKNETKETPDIANSKISNLLDDWDDGDTDSQQSDILKQDSETANSINNLINDWDDEEDS